MLGAWCLVRGTGFSDRGHAFRLVNSRITGGIEYGMQSNEITCNLSHDHKDAIAAFTACPDFRDKIHWRI